MSCFRVLHPSMDFYDFLSISEAFKYYSILTSLVAENSSKYKYLEGSIRKWNDTQAMALASHFFSLGDIHFEYLTLRMA